MIYVITFKELYDRSWLPIKTRATTERDAISRQIDLINSL